MTTWGFCVVAALSSQTSGRPWTRSRKIGKSFLMVAPSNGSSEARTSGTSSGRNSEGEGADEGAAAAPSATEVGGSEGTALAQPGKDSGTDGRLGSPGTTLGVAVSLSGTGGGACEGPRRGTADVGMPASPRKYGSVAGSSALVTDKGSEKVKGVASSPATGDAISGVRATAPGFAPEGGTALPGGAPGAAEGKPAISRK